MMNGRTNGAGNRQRAGRGAVFILIMLLTGTLSRAELVDRIVAAVNNDVITWSDLRQATGFNSALGGGQGDDRKVEAETLDGLINRRLLLQEAYRLRLVDVTDQEVAAELDRLGTKLGSGRAVSDLRDRLEMTGEQLARMLRERLLVEKFVEKKVSLFARVSREEADNYYREHHEQFAGKRFSEVQPQITALLSGQKTTQQLDLYLEELRGKAMIRKNPIDKGQETGVRRRPEGIMN